MSNFDIKSLIGETLSYIDDCGDQIVLTTVSGRKIRIYHEQECCESVRVEDTEGNWQELIGKVIIDIDEDIESGELGVYEYYTKTNLTFKVDGATVISKWIGESNGYYSESVDFAELTK